MSLPSFEFVPSDDFPPSLAESTLFERSQHPFFATLPQPEGTRTVSLIVGETFARVDDRQFRIGTKEFDLIGMLLDNRDKPIGWERISHVMPQIGTFKAYVGRPMNAIVRKFNMLEPIVEHIPGQAEAGIRLADNVVYVGDRLTADTVRPKDKVRVGWESRAACNGLPPENFELDSPKHTIDNTRNTVCGPCPVRTECLDDALLYGSDGVIRGGLVDKELEILRQEDFKIVPKQTEFPHPTVLSDEGQTIPFSKPQPERNFSAITRPVSIRYIDS